MGKREYGQFCGLARALEIIGERWALLIVRDLLVGPRRYTDLHRGLPRIPTNILSTRLKELEEAGVVRRRVLPRPATSVVYELTEHGRALDGVVLALGRWGARSLGEPGPQDIATAGSLVIAMRSTFNPPAARGVRVSYELRVDDAVIHLRVDDGALEVAEGPLPGADATIETGSAIRALLAGEVSPAEAIANGSLTLTGDPRHLSLFVDLFSITAQPTTTPV